MVVLGGGLFLISEVPLYSTVRVGRIPYGITSNRGIKVVVGRIPSNGRTLRQIDGFFSQLPYECHQNRVATFGD